MHDKSDVYAKESRTTKNNILMHRTMALPWLQNDLVCEDGQASTARCSELECFYDMSRYSRRADILFHEWIKVRHSTSCVFILANAFLKFLLSDTLRESPCPCRHSCPDAPHSPCPEHVRHRTVAVGRKNRPNIMTPG